MSYHFLAQHLLKQTESIKALEIKTSTVFNLGFANNTILSCTSLFCIIYLYFLFTAAMTAILNLIEALVIPTVMPVNEAKAEIETHPVIAGTKISNCSM